MTAPREHRRQLREELVAAAARQNASGAPTSSSWHRRGVAALAAAGVAVAVTIGAVTVAPDAASADVFRVAIRDGEAIITVDGVVEDPADAQAELRAAGLDATLVARPVAPSLEGDIIATTSTFGPLESDADTEGTRIVAFRVPTQERRPFTIEYGRRALPDETYEATESVPECDAYSGSELTDDVVAEIGERWGPVVRWQQQDGTSVSAVAPDDVPSGSVIASIVPLSPGSVLVRVSEGDGPLPEGAC